MYVRLDGELTVRNQQLYYTCLRNTLQPILYLTAPCKTKDLELKGTSSQASRGDINMAKANILTTWSSYRHLDRGDASIVEFHSTIVKTTCFQRNWQAKSSLRLNA